MKFINFCVYTFFLALASFQGNELKAAQNNEASTVLPIYSHKIEDVNLKYEDSLLAGDITLDNGYILKIVDYLSRDSQIVMVATNIQSKDKNKAEPYVIFNLLDSSSKGPKVVNVTHNGEYVKLSDGSVWQFGWWNKLSTKHWAPGQRVLVQGRGDKNEYTFINLDVTPDLINYENATGSYVVQ